MVNSINSAKKQRSLLSLWYREQCEKKKGFHYFWMLIEDSKVLLFQRTVNEQ